jgi:hypothetical protein
MALNASEDAVPSGDSVRIGGHKQNMVNKSIFVLHSVLTDTREASSPQGLGQQECRPTLSQAYSNLDNGRDSRDELLPSESDSSEPEDLHASGVKDGKNSMPRVATRTALDRSAMRRGTKQVRRNSFKFMDKC